MDYNKIELLFELVHMPASSKVYKAQCAMLIAEELRLLYKLRTKHSQARRQKQPTIVFPDSSDDDELSKDDELIKLLEACIKDIKDKTT